MKHFTALSNRVQRVKHLTKTTIKRRKWKMVVKPRAGKSPRRASAKSKESKVEKLILLAKKNKRKNRKAKNKSSSRRARRSSSSSTKKAKI